jgi:hypothetical protein
VSFDGEYKNRISSAVFEAIVNSSVHEGGDVATFRNAEIVSALVANLAIAVAGSAATKSPAARRAFCKEIAKRLGDAILFTEKTRAVGGLNSLQVVPDAPAAGRLQ